MKNIKKFILLDFITIKPYITLKNLLILLLISAMMTYFNRQISGAIAIVSMFSTIYISYPFAVGNQNGIDTLYHILGLSRDEIVIGRYSWTFIINGIGVLFAFCLSLLYSYIFNFDVQILELIIMIAVIFIALTLVQAFQLPIYFKHGYMKAKSLAYLPLLAISLIFAISTFVYNSLPKTSINSLFLFINNNLMMLGIISIFAWLISIVISYKLSMKFYNKREF